MTSHQCKMSVCFCIRFHVGCILLQYKDCLKGNSQIFEYQVLKAKDQKAPILQCQSNSPSSSGSSSGLSSTSSKAWVKHHCWASCLPTPEPMKALQIATHWPWINNCLISCNAALLTVFTDPVAHQNEHLWREIFHHWDPWIELLQTSLL